MNVYLDWNATTPPRQDVVEAVSRASVDAWGNASSVHFVGARARRVLEEARERIAALMGANPTEVVFTSGGTESNNIAIHAHLHSVRHVLCPRVEHPSVVRVVERAGEDHHVHWIEVGPSGVVQPSAVSACLEEVGEPALVVIQWVNHETGVIQPVEAIIDVARDHQSLIHVDAVQGVGKLSGRPYRGADTVAVTAHKIRGPKGIGALVGGACMRMEPLLFGGPQERRLRPGTESVPLAAGFGVAASWAESSPTRYDAVCVLRDQLENALIELGATPNGGGPRVAHVTNVSFEGLRADELVAALDVEGVCVSSGSACSAGSPESSAVITAMLGRPHSESALRASLGDETTAEQIEAAIQAFRLVIGRARSHG